MSDDIWNELLQGATNKSGFVTKNLVMLGDLNCGKSNLLAKIQGLESASAKSKICLEYSYIDFFAEDSEDDPISRVGVWQLEGETDHKDLLRFALNNTNFDNTAVVICLDFTKPWELVNSLNRWLTTIKGHIDSLNLDPAKLDECKKSASRRFQEYSEPDEGGKKKPHRHNQPEQVLPPLPEGALVENLGVPVIVTCCKTDANEMLEAEFGYKDGHFEYILAYLRKICLQYGAALIYTSVRKEKNCDLLLDYLQHCLYDIDFYTRAQVLEKDSIFVPIGWDSLTKIQTDFDNQKLTRDFEDPYDKIITVPPTIQLHKKAASKAVVATAEDDQAFLQRLFVQLQTDPTNVVDGQKKDFLDTMKKLGILNSPSKPTASEATPVSTPVSTPLSTPVTRPPLQRTPSTASPATGAAGGSSNEHDMLANFFNSLLSPQRDTGTTTAAREDAQSSLSRIKAATSSPKLAVGGGVKLASTLAAAADSPSTTPPPSNTNG